VSTTPHLYTFQALRLAPGADLPAAVRALYDGVRPPLDADARVRRRALADALKGSLPEVVEEGPEGEGPLELAIPGGPDGEALVEILVGVDVVEVTLTVVPGDPDLRRDFRRAWDALRVLEDAGLTIYDEQIGRALDLRDDLGPVVARFESVAAEADARERRPWWKLW
jgi:hypothetical protein